MNPEVAKLQREAAVAMKSRAPAILANCDQQIADCEALACTQQPRTGAPPAARSRICNAWPTMCCRHGVPSRAPILPAIGD